jgi:polysaccharide biosynthesis/export protein
MFMENLMARSIPNRSLLIVLSTAVASLGVACAPGIGNAITVDKYQDTGAPTTDDYIINPGDVLKISVWEQPNLSGEQPVRPDGKISLQLINEVQAAGKTPTKLQADLEAALKSVVLNPRVNVGVTNPRSPTISVVGEVGKQGEVELKPGLGVAQAIAAAGGLSTFAHKDRIFVQRKTAEGTVRILFNYDDLMLGTGKAGEFKLRVGDTVVVQ